MHRPLRDPWYIRVWHLVRGLLFYNTVYWRRASDGLNMPSLSQEERARQRPERNLEIIKPRMRPRAHLEVGLDEIPTNLLAGAEISDPVEITPGGDEHLAAPEDAVPRVYRTEILEDGTEQVYVKRRRYRRRLVTRGSPVDHGGFFARVFGKK